MGVLPNCAHEPLRMRPRGCKLRYGHRRGVGGDNGLCADQRIHLLENPCLEVVIHRRRLNNDLCRLEGVVCCHAFYPSDRSLLFSRRHLALADHPAKTALDDINARFDGPLVDVEQSHIDAFRGRHLGNPTAHDTGPDYPNGAYGHGRVPMRHVLRASACFSRHFGPGPRI
jgi:hypothetical protein